MSIYSSILKNTTKSFCVPSNFEDHISEFINNDWIANVKISKKTIPKVISVDAEAHNSEKPKRKMSGRKSRKSSPEPLNFLQKPDHPLKNDSGINSSQLDLLRRFSSNISSMISNVTLS